jgi:hypothetical protein
VACVSSSRLQQAVPSTPMAGMSTYEYSIPVTHCWCLTVERCPLCNGFEARAEGTTGAPLCATTVQQPTNPSCAGPIQCNALSLTDLLLALPHTQTSCTSWERAHLSNTAHACCSSGKNKSDVAAYAKCTLQCRGLDLFTNEKCTLRCRGPTHFADDI